MSTVYDAAALIAAESNNRRIWAEHRARLELGIEPITTAPVVAQVSRSPREVQLRRFLRGCRLVALTPDDAHRIGILLAATGTSDVIDAHVALVASDERADIWTSDPEDLRSLARHTDHPAGIQQV
ncbi:hypothetical protein MLP_33840 [Microlunatus phosphovorus NM-1]|uniref:PIN domain-containing protein n=1 Tax=Microlunatus phosphovorus (strain ATCC 700054 / DSM 10555 / JCM 9379 / NBRC 101784 / NCIMB 13414 / VKM Ac-1990 / NM-1) TaxID=1032480 RepID=F5XME1_MICPN|nr:hypothetical protein [Microlunatus phosphovorus]BAK36398.1 hypothetical protein MLP_33840 [Microlunatus phosphovorus NM-1]